MKLLLRHQRKQLIRNGEVNGIRSERGEIEIDYMPVVRLFIPGQPWIWLFSEMNPDDSDQVYGLWDVGNGPRLGVANLFAISLLRDIQQDERFVPAKSLDAYAQEAIRYNRIIA